MSDSDRSKITTQFTLESDVTPEIKEKAEKLLKLHDGRLGVVVLLPNISGGWGMSSLSGFAAQGIKDRTPVIADFFGEKMEQKIMIYEIPKGTKMFGGTIELTEDSIKRNLSKIKLMMNSLYVEESKNGELIEGKGKEKFESMKTKILSKQELGNGGSHIGIGISKQREGYAPETKFFLYSQTYSPSANNVLKDLMEEAAPGDLAPGQNPKITWDSFFSIEKNKNFNWIVGSINRNAKIQMAQFVDILGLQHPNKKMEIDLEEDYQFDNSSSSDSKKKIYKLKPTIQMTTNSVELDYSLSKKGSSFPVFRSGAINPNTPGTTGIVFNSNPYLGPEILKGIPSSSNEYGSSWKASEIALGSFPIYTGRSQTIKNLSRKFQNQNQSYFVSSNPTLMEPFTWNNDGRSFNPRLVEGAYRLRSKQFRSIESQLGYKSENGSIHIEPLIVKLANEN